MKATLIGIDSKDKGSIELNDKVFGSDVNDNVIYEAIKNQLANKRQGTASAKTRAEVHGTNTKPFKQKGGGRARAGSNRSPLWRGGGVIFAPKPRDYSYSIPKKVRRSALFSILSMFQKDGKLKIIEDFTQTNYKTKDIVDIFSKISDQKKVIFIANSDERENYEKIKKSGDNISWLRIVNSKSIELKDLYYAHEVVLSKATVDELNKRYG